jgi:hypothetical protein
MGRPRLHPIRNTLAAITIVGAMLLTFAAPASATPWQKSWGDYDSQQQWHDASWWLDNQHDWVISHHPEWTENYRFHGRHYGDGGSDRLNAAALQAAKDRRAKAAAKAEAAHES